MSSLTFAISNLSVHCQINPFPISCHLYISGIKKSISLHRVQRGINLTSVAWIWLFIMLFTVPLFPCLPSSLCQDLKPRGEDDVYKELERWAKTLASPVFFCMLNWKCVCVCVFVTHVPLTFLSHSPITLAWTSLWHSGIISRHVLTGSAPSSVCCCCVGCLCLCLRKNKRDWGTGVSLRVCLCALFSDLNSVRADHLYHISFSSSCHIRSFPICCSMSL